MMRKKLAIALLLFALPLFAQTDTQWALQAVDSHLSHVASHA